MFALKKPSSIQSMPLEEALRKRASCRDFIEGAFLPENVLSQLLWAAQGKRSIQSHDGDAEKRVTPSAGGQYPLTLYIALSEGQILPTGLYKYNTQHHALIEVCLGGISAQLREASITSQSWVASASAVLIVCADMEKMIQHFSSQSPSKRGERYAYLEAGALAQNVHLQATALGYGMVLVGGFYDATLKKILRLEKLAPIAMLCLGKNA